LVVEVPTLPVDRAVVLAVPPHKQVLLVGQVSVMQVAQCLAARITTLGITVLVVAVALGLLVGQDRETRVVTAVTVKHLRFLVGHTLVVVVGTRTETLVVHRNHRVDLVVVVQVLTTTMVAQDQVRVEQILAVVAVAPTIRAAEMRAVLG
jgi:hypothetical protein